MHTHDDQKVYKFDKVHTTDNRASYALSGISDMSKLTAGAGNNDGKILMNAGQYLIYFQSIGKHIWQMCLSTNPHVVPSSKQQTKCLKLTKCPPFPI